MIGSDNGLWQIQGQVIISGNDDLFLIGTIFCEIEM